jgi:hypothetical protein
MSSAGFIKKIITPHLREMKKKTGACIFRESYDTLEVLSTHSPLPSPSPVGGGGNVGKGMIEIFHKGKGGQNENSKEPWYFSCGFFHHRLCH